MKAILKTSFFLLTLLAIVSCTKITSNYTTVASVDPRTASGQAYTFDTVAWQYNDDLSPMNIVHVPFPFGFNVNKELLVSMMLNSANAWQVVQKSTVGMLLEEFRYTVSASGFSVSRPVLNGGSNLVGKKASFKLKFL